MQMLWGLSVLGVAASLPSLPFLSLCLSFDLSLSLVLDLSFSLPLSFSLSLSVLGRKRPAMKVGAAGLRRCVRDFDAAGGRLPMTPTWLGDAWGLSKASSSRISSSADASVVLRAEWT